VNGLDSIVETTGRNGTPMRPATSFVTRARASSAALELSDFDDTDLAALAVGPDERAELATQVLLERRLGAIIERAARRVCQQLAHLGVVASCPSECEFAKPSARAAFAQRTAGFRYASTAHGGMFMYAPSSRRPNSRRSKGQIESWLRRSEDRSSVMLPAWVHADLHKSGRTTDARRRWNEDRGLLVRIAVPKRFAERFTSRIDKLLVEHPDNPTLTKMKTSTAALDPSRWARALYDDACETAPTNQPIFYRRVARAVGLPDGNDAAPPETIKAIDAADSLLQDVANELKNTFYDRYFEAARRLTRTWEVPMDNIESARYPRGRTRNGAETEPEQ
jgi:hypothetical protein